MQAATMSSPSMPTLLLNLLYFTPALRLSLQAPTPPRHLRALIPTPQLNFLVPMPEPRLSLQAPRPVCCLRAPVPTPRLHLRAPTLAPRLQTLEPQLLEGTIIQPGYVHQAVRLTTVQPLLPSEPSDDQRPAKGRHLTPAQLGNNMLSAETTGPWGTLTLASF